MNDYQNILPLIINNKKYYPSLTIILNNLIIYIKEYYQNKPKELKVAASYVVTEIYKLNPNLAINNYHDIISKFFDYFNKNFDSFKNEFALISDYFYLELQFYKLFIKNYMDNN
ncbi:MAG: hypothetical protein ACOCVF_02520 [bacterium]